VLLAVKMKWKHVYAFSGIFRAKTCETVIQTRSGNNIRNFYLTTVVSNHLPQRQPQPLALALPLPSTLPLPLPESLSTSLVERSAYFYNCLIRNCNAYPVYGQLPHCRTFLTPSSSDLIFESRDGIDIWGGETVFKLKTIWYLMQCLKVQTFNFNI